MWTERTPAAEPGWYGDALDHQRHRYWDGGRWTDQVRHRVVLGEDTFFRKPPPPFTVTGVRGTRRSLCVSVVLLTGVVWLAAVFFTDVVIFVVLLSLAYVWKTGGSRRRWAQILGFVEPDAPIGVR